MKLKWLWGGLATAFLIALLWGGIIGAMDYDDGARICRDPSVGGFYSAVDSNLAGCLSDARYTSTVRASAAYGIVFTIGVLLTAAVVSLNRPQELEQHQPVRRRRAPKKSMAPFEQ